LLEGGGTGWQYKVLQTGQVPQRDRCGMQGRAFLQAASGGAPILPPGEMGPALQEPGQPSHQTLRLVQGSPLPRAERQQRLAPLEDFLSQGTQRIGGG
jgi:hypothetical protein